jgi:hypothetical protein
MLLAAFLRLYRLDLVSVSNDTAYQVLYASTAWSDWPLAGADTDEVRSSAFLVSAIAVVDLIWWHPFSGVVVVVALNLCAIAILYRMCAGQFGRLAAGISTLLYASSPWSVLFARTLLPASCLALFSVWLIHLSLRWLEEKRNAQLTMMVLLALAMPQIHFSGMCAPVWLVLVLYRGRKHVSILSLVTGGMLGAAVWVPWIVFQQRAGWSEVKTWAGQIIQTPQVHGRALLASVNHLQGMLHSGKLDYWFGESPSRWPAYFPAWLCWGLSVAAVLLVLLFVSALWSINRKPDRRMLLLAWWVALPVLCGALLRTGLSPENMLIAYPVPFVLVGAMAVQLQEMLPRPLRFLPTSVLIGVAALHVVFLGECARFVADGRTSSSGRYELSYRQRRSAIEAVLRDADGDPVRLIGPYSGWHPAYEYVLLYEPTNQSDMSEDPDELVRYWIDQESPDPELSESRWRNKKERQINLEVAEYLHTPPDWEIERHWSVEESQIYRLRFARKQPLR